MASSKIFTGNNIADFEQEINDWFNQEIMLELNIFNIFFLAREQVSTPGIDLTLALLYDLNGTVILDNVWVATLFNGIDGASFEETLNTFIDAQTEFVQGPYIDYQKERRNINKYNALVITNADKSQADSNWFVNLSQP